MTAESATSQIPRNEKKNKQGERARTMRTSEQHDTLGSYDEKNPIKAPK